MVWGTTNPTSLQCIKWPSSFPNCNQQREVFEGVDKNRRSPFDCRCYSISMPSALQSNTPFVLAPPVSTCFHCQCKLTSNHSCEVSNSEHTQAHSIINIHAVINGAAFTMLASSSTIWAVIHTCTTHILLSSQQLSQTHSYLSQHSH